MRKNKFRIATGFAATPYVCDALVMTGPAQVAYGMLLEKECPSWAYATTMGATTVWKRWNSMLPDGSVNTGEMTSFNHYAYGVVAKFMYEDLRDCNDWNLDRRNAELDQQWGLIS